MVERFQMKTEHDWICARPDDKGDWVRHSDYARLQEQAERWCDKYLAALRRAELAEAERDRLRDGENRLNLARENLRETMLAQATSGRRETYTDGFHQGLCYAIERLDLLLNAALQKEPQP